jgi:hypothetical protein
MQRETTLSFNTDGESFYVTQLDPFPAILVLKPK